MDKITSTPHTPSPILVAVRSGDGDELKKLLNQKSEAYDPSKMPVYPGDWKYKYSDLLELDSKGKTPLQLACSHGNHDMALECVTLLCESVQVFFPESEGDERDKLTEYINFTLPGPGPGRQSPLHFAIENKARKVIAYLLDKNADVHIASQKGTNALLLICQQVPDAVTALYDSTIQLSKDYKKIEIDLVKLIGVHKPIEPMQPEPEPADQHQSLEQNNRETETENKNTSYHKVYVNKVKGDHNSHKIDNWNTTINDSSLDTVLWKETECMKYILDAGNWGTHLLLHPLVTLFLQKKWEKVGWFFFIPFFGQIMWLLLYSVAFVELNLYMEVVNVTKDEKDTVPNRTELKLKPPLVLWTVLVFSAGFNAVKELYFWRVLKSAYISFEALAQVSFILVHFIQFTLLILGYLVQAATISVLGVAVSTTLMIFQLGKIPCFAQQVAAMKKMLYSFAPHLPLFFVWFLGFCLIFWALFYKSSESSVIVLLAIVAAMGTGEINAHDHLKGRLERPVELNDFISVFCLMLFVIIIATLYLNLLVGYAVSDIQALKQEAETFAICSRLETIYYTETFLLSPIGRCFVRLYECARGHSGSGYMDSIYLIPPSKFQKNHVLKISVDSDNISPQILEKLTEIAYQNSLKKKKIFARLKRRIEKLYQNRRV